jgi:hypothetical protein
VKIEGGIALPLAREALWEKLFDPAVLKAAIPGCEQLEGAGEHHWKAVVSFGLGPIRGRFRARVRLEEPSRPDGYTLVVEGQGPAGVVQGRGRVTLSPDGEGTRLTYAGDVSVGGLVASVGQRMLSLAARKAVEDFFAGLRAAVQAR